MNVAVLITSHNRRELTLRCLGALAKQRAPGIQLTTWLVDDGSTDGTSAAVREAFPEVHIVPGSGDLYWGGGMRLAWEHAAATDPDAYFWLNDDVVLAPDAVERLYKTARRHPVAIVVGSCASPVTGRRTYGGLRRRGPHPGKVEPIDPELGEQYCDTFEGNIVWVPRIAYEQLGPIAHFRHAMGDLDYGYRAQRLRIACVLAAGFFGACSPNTLAGTWQDPSLGRVRRLQKLRGTKGLPATDWWKFCRRHGGARAPIYFVKPLLRVLAGQ